ncbi:hypothetical protein QBC37DRAFT_457703 [Rhypophila decipiens]|uniref:Uncharacterized protein n=1 Tax=Rhypophila decipiens TaxID=261697 RepID=A0AAN6XWA4_9PEZI|nr:hypothetical protein QBC37DRAFT_457703 [Rhypophila decipiens]
MHTRVSSGPNLPWGSRFVNSHVLLVEGSEIAGIIPAWKHIRFDAVDVLFVGPFSVKVGGTDFILGGDGSNLNLNARFEWVVRAARTQNSKIKIVVVQYMGESDNQDNRDFKSFGTDETKITRYAKSVASFVEGYYNRTLPALSGSGTVSARIDGYDVDVEGSNLSENLPRVLAAVRRELEPCFSVSITPFRAEFLDSSIASSCDYINVQNYDGGAETEPEDYLAAVKGFKRERLVWGLHSERPWVNNVACQTFEGVKSKVQEVIDGKAPGIWNWRLNSDNYVYENLFQVWLYNAVHGTRLYTLVDDSQLEYIVERYWQKGGRRGEIGSDMPILSLEDLVKGVSPD